MTKLKYLYVCFILTFLSNAYASELIKSTCSTPLKQPHVAFITAGDASSYFWDNSVNFMKEASKQLGIKFTVHQVNNNQTNRINFPSTVDNFLTNIAKPDYLISYYWPSTNKELMNVMKKHNVNIFTINTPLEGKTENTAGKPREYFSNWIGHLAPNDYQAGYDLMDYLIKHVKKNERKPLSVVAINGTKNNNVSVLREKGLLDRLKESKNIKLLQIAYTDWGTASGVYMMERIIKRFKEFDIVWSAGDNITEGVIKALAKVDSMQVNPPLIGSISWSKMKLPLLQKPSVEVSYGGHTIDGAIALGLVFDHYNQHDFEPYLGSAIQSILMPFSIQSIDKISSKKVSTIDFTILSKCLSGYNKSDGYLITPLELLSTYRL